MFEKGFCGWCSEWVLINKMERDLFDSIGNEFLEFCVFKKCNKKIL